MKRALITGANRGIGLELTKCLLKQKYVVDAICRSMSTELSELPVTVINQIDVTQSVDLAKAKDALKDNRYDILINNAGLLCRETIEHFDSIQKEQTIQQYLINSVAPVEITSLFLDQLKSSSKCIFITSRMGSISDNDSGARYGYRMSKAALNAAVKSMAIDLADRDIAIGLFHPGWVKTGMTGYTGNIDANHSARQLMKRIEECSLETSGLFFHVNGQQIPW